MSIEKFVLNVLPLLDKGSLEDVEQIWILLGIEEIGGYNDTVEYTRPLGEAVVSRVRRAYLQAAARRDSKSPNVVTVGKEHTVDRVLYLDKETP